MTTHISDGEWTGDERRSIPVHILNYMDTRLGEHTTRIEALFQDHVTDEMERYGDIINRIDASAKASQDRHTALVDQITVFTGRVELVEKAFPESKQGWPDYNKHHGYHSTVEDKRVWWSSVRDQALKKMFEWGLILLVGWFGIIVWRSLLLGPQ
jgi:hypothetical protein